MPDISLSVTFTLPEGFEGTPQELCNAIAESARFQATGAFIAGQMGGVEPTADVGLYISDGQIKVWSGSKYVPIDAVPIGAVIDYPSALSVPPENYLFCDVSPASSLILIADYPELYAVIGRTWSNPDDDVLKFRLPPYAGRDSIGAGTGKYDPKETGIGAGSMTPHIVGDLFGHEWLTANTPTADGAPSGRFSSPSTKLPIANKTIYHGVSSPKLTVRKIIRYI